MSGTAIPVNRETILSAPLILNETGRRTDDDFACILAAVPSARAPRVAARAIFSYAQAEAEFERQTLTMLAAKGQISEGIRLIDISRASLYKKLAKFGTPPTAAGEAGPV